jgi:DNA-binding LacI/PurR family transcriptional regulator
MEQKPDAIFANNDMAAVGAMLACKSLGYRIPEEIGIVGFSNWQFCAMIEPTLSSVAQPGFKIGVKATELLLDMIEKKIDPDTITEPIVLETELLIRNSSVK